MVKVVLKMITAIIMVMEVIIETVMITIKCINLNTHTMKHVGVDANYYAKELCGYTYSFNYSTNLGLPRSSHGSS